MLNPSETTLACSVMIRASKANEHTDLRCFSLWLIHSCECFIAGVVEWRRQQHKQANYGIDQPGLLRGFASLPRRVFYDGETYIWLSSSAMFHRL